MPLPEDLKPLLPLRPRPSRTSVPYLHYKTQHRPVAPIPHRHCVPGVYLPVQRLLPPFTCRPQLHAIYPDTLAGAGAQNRVYSFDHPPVLALLDPILHPWGPEHDLQGILGDPSVLFVGVGDRAAWTATPGSQAVVEGDSDADVGFRRCVEGAEQLWRGCGVGIGNRDAVTNGLRGGVVGCEIDTTG